MFCTMLTLNNGFLAFVKQIGLRVATIKDNDPVMAHMKMIMQADPAFRLLVHLKPKSYVAADLIILSY